MSQVFVVSTSGGIVGHPAHRAFSEVHDEPKSKNVRVLIQLHEPGNRGQNPAWRSTQTTPSSPRPHPISASGAGEGTGGDGVRWRSERGPLPSRWPTPTCMTLHRRSTEPCTESRKNLCAQHHARQLRAHLFRTIRSRANLLANFGAATTPRVLFVVGSDREKIQRRKR